MDYKKVFLQTAIIKVVNKVVRMAYFLPKLN